MTTKPLIHIPVDRNVRRTYQLSAQAARLLDSYAEFLSDYSAQGGTDVAAKGVSPGQIISRLTERLAGDKAFLAWQAKRSASAPEPS
jgi:hypothetical protein